MGGYLYVCQKYHKLSLFYSEFSLFVVRIRKKSSSISNGHTSAKYLQLNKYKVGKHFMITKLGKKKQKKTQSGVKNYKVGQVLQSGAKNFKVGQVLQSKAKLQRILQSVQTHQDTTLNVRFHSCGASIVS